MNQETKDAISFFQDASKRLDPEKSQEIVNELVLAISKPLIETFYLMGMKDGIESTITNPPTGDTFYFSFKIKKECNKESQ